MKSERSPIHLSEEPESMATLVERGRRLGRFWPAAVEPKPYPRPAGQPPRRPTYRIGAREARLFGEVPE